MTPLEICMVASEVAPFAKTGGLADVAAALSRALARAGAQVRVVMPMYERVRTSGASFKPVPELQDIAVPLGPHRFWVSFSTAPLQRSTVKVYFVRCPQLYGREGLYTEDGDEHLRFALLSQAALVLCQHLQWAPDVFHCNDWHTALLPLYLRTQYAWDSLFAGSRTLLTIHNIAYQGVFPDWAIEDLGLQGLRTRLHPGDLLDKRVNLLRTGLLHADAISTVSATYAREIQSGEMGMGLQETLSRRADKVTGIVNGVDYGEWSPAKDRHLPHRYGPKDLRGKVAMKRALLERVGLPSDEDALATPLIGMVTRLTWQKGLDLLPETVALLQQQDARLVVLGSGEERYERWLDGLQRALPDRVAYDRGYKEDLAHWIEAGSDLFLMPSRFEPCGLNQMYSLKYGTPPLVRRTGGLADTVAPWDPRTRTGTGFLFDSFDADALRAALRFALVCYRDREGWKQLMLNGMAQDFSWEHQVEAYLELYRSLLAEG